jgi:hypothetical protein
MMKLILILLLSIAGALSAWAVEGPFRVQGEGETLQQARQNAFRTAIERAYGSAIVSDRQSVNGDLVKDDILNYASGYVADYRLIDTQQKGGKTVVVLDIWVNDSKIADRILGASTTPNVIDAEKQFSQLNSLLDAKKKGDQLIQQVMSDFPSKAFTIKSDGLEINLNDNREPWLSIKYAMRWNYKYLMAVNEALSLSAASKNGIISPILDRLAGQSETGYVTIMAKDPKDFILGNQWHYRPDNYKYNILQGILIEKEPYIMVAIRNTHSYSVWKACVKPQWAIGKAFYSAGENLAFYGNTVETGWLNFDIDQTPELAKSIRQANTVELNIVSGAECD